jgi:hypothetical protein
MYSDTVVLEYILVTLFIRFLMCHGRLQTQPCGKVKTEQAAEAGAPETALHSCAFSTFALKGGDTATAGQYSGSVSWKLAFLLEILES